MSEKSNFRFDDPCRCCSSKNCSVAGNGLNRRDFLVGTSTASAGLALSTLGVSALAQNKEPGRKPPINLALKVQPVLICEFYKPREKTSWRPWGAVMNEQDLAEEKNRINKELEEMKATADFPMEILPLVTLNTVEEAAKVVKGNHDVLVQYPANGSGRILETLTDPNKWTLMFLRHKSGPVYLWYEIAHNIFLRKQVDEFGQPGIDWQDVVVDKTENLLWRLKALHGLKNTLGKKIIAVGGAGGWGAGGQKAPEIARSLWKLNIQDVSYDIIADRVKKARQNEALVKRTQNDAENYLNQKDVSLETAKQFVVNAFLLTEVFHDLMEEAGTDAMTINGCMGTIMPISETTACIPLTLLNDGGYMAFCESDFVVIPSGILLHYLSNKPMFFNDPTYPHDGVVTMAHCTGPRKMDGKNAEPVRILTHFESDYGAAPKVEMKLGQKTTNLIPDFNCKNWVGFEGEIVDNPFYAICRCQVDMQINGDCDKLVEETKGFHWMTCYDNYLKETGYALKKLGVNFLNLSKTKEA